MPFFTKRKQDSLEKWLNPELGQRKYKMNLGHLVVPESKDVLRNIADMSLKKKKNKKKRNTDWLVWAPIDQIGNNLSIKTNNDC